MGGDTNPVSPMQGSTSNPTSSTPVVETGVGVDNQYINLDGEENIQVNNMTNDQNEGPGVGEGNTQNPGGVGDGDAVDKVELKRKCQKTSMEEDWNAFEGEMSAYAHLFEPDEDYDVHLLERDDVDELDMSKLKEAKEAWLAALAAFKEKQDEESHTMLGDASLHMQSLLP